MPRDTLVRTVMTTDVLTFGPDQGVREAMGALVERGVDGAPVVDEDGSVVGVLSNGDLIVEESEVHVPTVISLLGASIELPASRHRFAEDLRRALGASVGDVMSRDPVTIAPDATLREAATSMNDRDVSRLPVVDADGRLIGIIARNDILRAMIADPGAED